MELEITRIISTSTRLMPRLALIVLICVVGNPTQGAPIVADGLLEATGIQLGASGTQSSITSTTDADAIRNAALGNGTGIFNIGGPTVEVITNSVALVARPDFGGNTGDFSPTLPLPGGITGFNFLINIQAELFFPAGTYTLYFDSNDGASVVLDAALMFNRFGLGAGEPAAPNEIRSECSV